MDRCATTQMFEKHETDRRLVLRMPATLEAIDSADDYLAQYLTVHAIPVDAFAARILLRESLLNAVTHGSGKDPARRVLFEVAVGDDSMTLAAADDGPGFEWRTRTPGFDVLGDGGRGLALMELYSDEMVFNDAGNRVEFRKYFRTPAAATPASEAERTESVQ